MHKVLIVGGSGLVGKAVTTEIIKDEEFDVYGTYYKNPVQFCTQKVFKLDINNHFCISNILNSLKPQIVISCLRGNFSDQLTLHKKVSEYLKEINGRLYFCSTVNVFDNDLSTPHYEYDLTNSCTDYGQYKIECEKEILNVLGGNACILRLPQIWGIESPRMKALLNSLSTDKTIEVYPKLFCTMSTDIMVARQVYYAVKHNFSGIFHLTTVDTINQKDFHERLIKGLGYSNARLLDNFEEKGFFALLSKKINEFPEFLRFTNRSVISYLIN